jgi:hypothetical protein
VGLHRQNGELFVGTFKIVKIRWHRAAEQALGADSPVSSLYSQLRGRAAQAQRYASGLNGHDNERTSYASLA